MTDRKDFKRVVRARARRTGESYSSALRNVRSARSARSDRAAASSLLAPIAVSHLLITVSSVAPRPSWTDKRR